MLGHDNGGDQNYMYIPYIINLQVSDIPVKPNLKIHLILFNI